MVVDGDSRTAGCHRSNLQTLGSHFRGQPNLMTTPIFFFGKKLNCTLAVMCKLCIFVEESSLFSNVYLPEVVYSHFFVQIPFPPFSPPIINYIFFTPDFVKVALLDALRRCSFEEMKKAFEPSR